MATINELQDEVVEEFQDFSDWMDKYQMLFDLAASTPATSDSAHI